MVWAVGSQSLKMYQIVQSFPKGEEKEHFIFHRLYLIVSILSKTCFIRKEGLFSSTQYELYSFFPNAFSLLQKALNHSIMTYSFSFFLFSLFPSPYQVFILYLFSFLDSKHEQSCHMDTAELELNFPSLIDVEILVTQVPWSVSYEALGPEVSSQDLQRTEFTL